MHPEERKKVFKRQYSRSGCIECKRRKIKCNEDKPACANCTRVEVACVYPEPNHRNRIRKRRSAEANTGAGVQGMVAAPRQAPHSLLDFDMSIFENIFDDANTLIHGLVDYENQMEDPTTLFQESQQDVPQDLKPFHSHIILNDIPGPMQEKKHYLFLDENELQSYLKDPSFDVYTGSAHSEPLAAEEHKKSNSELVQSIIDKYKLAPEEALYFRDFALGPGCAYFYPFAANRQENEVMKVLLEYCQYLKYMVYAMMAVSASMKFSHMRRDADDKCQRRFTAICMRLLVQVFTDLQDNVSSLWNVEGLILTILLRTMLFSDMTVVDMSWLSHLNEAKSLLIKYNQLKSQTSLYKPDSPGIAIAKQLFFCYDSSNRIASPVNNVKSSDAQDLRNLWEYSGPESDPLHASSDALLNLKVLVPAQNGVWFNTFNGLTPAHMHVIHEFYTVFGELNAANAGATEFKTQASPAAICRLMALLDAALSQTIVPGISAENQFLIQLDNPAHPLYPDESSRIVLPASAYGIDTRTGQYYSWCDAVSMSQVYFLFLKLLTCKGLLFLPRSHPLIKSLVRKIIGLMFFVKEAPQAAENKYYLCESSFDYRAIMMQLPLRLSIALTDEEDDFDKLELFFRGMVKLGCGNSTLPLANIEKYRKKSEERRLKAAQGIKDDQESDYCADIYLY